MATSLTKEQESWVANPSQVAAKLDAWVMLTALLAALPFQMFRAEYVASLQALWAENVVFFLLPFVFGMVFPRVWKADCKEPRILGQAGAALVILLSIVWQLVSRSMGFGDSNEVFVVLVVQHLSWFLAVYCIVSGFEKISLVLCGAIVFFVLCMSERFEILVLAAIFGVVSLWQLAGLYWNRLNQNALDGHSEMLPIRSGAIGLSAVVLMGLALLIGQTNLLKNQIDIRGFSPFSGGEGDDEDARARAGIGDGQMLVAGKDPTTTGPVESDQFIQDHRESMYDVTLERFDGPVFKRPRNRSVAIDETSIHMHDVKQSEQAGRSFRTMRESDKTDKNKVFESKETKALFFVEGSVPARFATNSFNHFDGWDWTSKPFDNTAFLLPRIQLQQQPDGNSVYQICQIKPKFLTSIRRHRVKLMRLQANCIPAPSFMDRWHIAHVSDPDLFKWGSNGLVQMEGDYIATHTMIDIASCVPNFNVLRDETNRLKKWRAQYLPSKPVNDSPFRQLPETSSIARLNALAAEWLKDTEPGWNQVDTIVSRLKTEFELIPDWQVDSDAEDSVTLFLDHKGGPPYMFATTCALMLRTIGFDSRLQSGFAVSRRDYDRIAQQSVVTSEHLHMWPEVSIDGRLWIPVEPTPGFAAPYSTQTLWNRLVNSWNAVLSFAKQHPVKVALLIAISILSYLFRKVIVASIAFAWWYLVKLFWPQRLLQATRQLLDLRFRIAGLGRPKSSTLRSWYTQPAPTLSPEFFELWNSKHFQNTPSPVPLDQLVRQCSEAVRALPLAGIKQYASSTRKAEKHD